MSHLSAQTQPSVGSRVYVTVRTKQHARGKREVLVPVTGVKEMDKAEFDEGFAKEKQELEMP